jgi:undecaprenyl phosphate-alpha-L-ara4N flippase subunit ArnE
MSATGVGIVLICVCAAMEGFAQISLKLSADPTRRWALWLAISTAMFLLAAVIYSGALRVLNVSVAYALDALGFVSVVLLSQVLLREHVPPVRWLGVVLIFIGTSLIVLQA